MKEIFEMIKEDFSQTWKMNMRGETMEVTTPISTTNDFFVSLFVSKRDFGFVISDGGYLSVGGYDVVLPEKRIFKELMLHYIDTYGISQTEGRGRTYYYKTVKTPIEVASAVFDMSAFLGAIICAADADQSFKRVDRNETFKKKANDYIKSTFADRNCRFSLPVEGVPDITLSASVPGNHGITLINYVSGGNYTDFTGALCRSVSAFQIISQKPLDIVVNNKVHLLDTQSVGFKDEKSRPFIDFYADGKDSQIIHWEDRAELAEIIA